MQASAVDDLVDTVLQASRAFVSIATRSLAAAPGNITLPQYRALVVLASRGPQRPSELAADLGVAASTVTRLCDRLARKGLIVREVSSESRREVQTLITARGRALVDAVTDSRRREIEAIVAAIPPSRRRSVARALEEFTGAVGEIPDRAWPAGFVRP